MPPDLKNFPRPIPRPIRVRAATKRLFSYRVRQCLSLVQSQIGNTMQRYIHCVGFRYIG